MKRLLLAAVIGTSLTYPPVQAYCPHSYYYHNVAKCPQCQFDETVGKVVVTVAAAGLTFMGACYLFNKLPSRQYASAQKTYTVLDEGVLRLLEEFDPVCGDISTFANELYPRSAYPLVTLFNALDKTLGESKDAIQKIDNAQWWSKEEQFTRACELLKKKLKQRISTYESLSSLIRASTAWQPQYTTYLQKCQNDELKRLALQVVLNGMNHSCHTYHYCHHC